MHSIENSSSSAAGLRREDSSGQPFEDPRLARVPEAFFKGENEFTARGFSERDIIDKASKASDSQRFEYLLTAGIIFGIMLLVAAFILIPIAPAIVFITLFLAGAILIGGSIAGALPGPIEHPDETDQQRDEALLQALEAHLGASP